MLPQTILLLLSGALLAVCSPIASSAGKNVPYLLMILRLTCDQSLPPEHLSLPRRSVLHLPGPSTPMKPKVTTKGRNAPLTPMRPRVIIRERNAPSRMPMKSRVTIKASGLWLTMPMNWRVTMWEKGP